MSTRLISKRFLNLKGIRYATIKIPENLDHLYLYGTENIPVEQIAKNVILQDNQSTVMAIIPAANHIQIKSLNAHLQRNLELIQQVNIRGYQLHCPPGRLPCLGEAFGFETIIDESLAASNDIYFTSGNPGELIRISTKDFNLLHSNAWYGKTFSSSEKFPSKKVTSKNSVKATPSVSEIRQLVDTINNLPPMPTMALQIIQLGANPYAHVNDLAVLIESDPSLTAQIIRQAQSPLYGYQGELKTISQAISRVLGYDMVMNIALGIAATRPFSNSISGPMGIKNYWRHATYSAAVCQAICSLFPSSKRPQAGTAYLCGLLHNFGFLLLGHLFPKELIRLNKSIVENPLATVRTLEQKLIQTDHTEIGSQLMKSWSMPKEIVVTLAHHHNFEYDGEHSIYVKLVQLADILLKGHGLGDADFNEIPAPLLQQLNLREEQLYVIFEKTIQARNNLDIMARQMAA